MPFLAPAAAAAAAFAATAVGGFLINLAVTFVIGKVMQKRMKKKMEAMQRANRPSVMVNTASNTEAIPALYGQTRIGGNRLFTESTNGTGNTSINSHLNMLFSICEGEVETLQQIYFDDVIVWDADNGGGFEADGIQLKDFTGKYEPALNAASGSKLVFYKGSDSQTSNSLLQTSIGSQWTSAHRLRGVCYIGMVLKSNAEIYKGGLPLMTFVVKGKKIKNVSSLPSSVTLTSGADQNPVDVLYDYLTNPRYGKGLDHDSSGNYSAGLNIDLDSFKTARTQATGYYKINGILDTSQDLYANIGEILESMNGLLVFQNGKYILKLQSRGETSVASLTAIDILSPMSVQMPAKSDKFNKVLADYRNKASGTNYNDDIVIVENSTFLTEDKGTELESRIRLDLVDDESLVTDIANYAMNSSRFQQTVSFDAAHTALRLQCGEIIKLNLSEFGWSTADGYTDGKPFRINQMSLNPDNSISITATEYESTIELIP